jgi:hypothetical protein
MPKSKKPKRSTRSPKAGAAGLPGPQLKPPLHEKTHKLIAKALSASSLAATQQLAQTTLARLVLLLESYGRKNPVYPGTPVGAATWDLDTLATDINERWNFPPGRGYQTGQIDGTWITQQLAQDISFRGGVLNGK